MRKRTIGILLLVLIGVVGFLQLVLLNSLNLNPLVPIPKIVNDSFEDSLKWSKDSDLPIDANNPGQYVDWEITQSSEKSKTGSNSMCLEIDGHQDDGTIWLEREISVQKNTEINVDLSFELYSPSESFNTIAVVVGCISLDDPESEADFTVLGSANMVEGWQKYSLSETFTTDESGTIWVGVGISVRWETVMQYYIDDVEINIT